MIAYLRRLRAIARLSRHERQRVSMGCPGVPSFPGHDADHTLTPRLGEVYCRCRRCRADRLTAGWDALPGEPR